MEESQTLNFIGIGSCFNTEFGNNAAYHFDSKKKSLLLMDCGESIFERIRKLKLLEKAEDINILITHMHTDHVGSLPSLIFFCQFARGIKPTIVYPEKEVLEQFLTIAGNEPKTYQLVQPAECEKIQIEAIKQQHSKFISAYGYVLELGGKKVYYSGDTKTIDQSIMQAFKDGEFDEFYQDVSRYETPAHMNIETLSRIFDEEERKRITCMHFDDEITRQKAESLGFNIAKVRSTREIEIER